MRKLVKPNKDYTNCHWRKDNENDSEELPEVEYSLLHFPSAVGGWCLLWSPMGEGPRSCVAPVPC